VIEVDAAALLTRIDTLMSTYRRDSELSRFNAAESTAPIAVSKETGYTIDEALRVGALTDGTIRKTQGTLRVDLSGIAKGYAVDRLAAIFDGHGVRSYLIDIGGELRSRGRNRDGRPWRVGVERPVPGTRAVHRVVRLENRAVATSGDYRNFFVHEGQRYTYAIDPRTARPVTHPLASVTFVDDNAMRADALSKGMMVMGPNEGMELARTHDVAAYFIVRTGDGFEERFTPAFERFLTG